jgi:hypothetical protein
MAEGGLHWSRILGIGAFLGGFAALVVVPAAYREASEAVSDAASRIVTWHDELMALDDHWRYLYASIPISISILLLLVAWEMSSWKKKGVQKKSSGLTDTDHSDLQHTWM